MGLGVSTCLLYFHLLQKVKVLSQKAKHSSTCSISPERSWEKQGESSKSGAEGAGMSKSKDLRGVSGFVKISPLSDPPDWSYECLQLGENSCEWS